MPYQIHHHGDYLEVHLEGVLDSAFPAERARAEGGEELLRVLLDWESVTEVRAGSDDLAEQARRGEELGLKVAVYAPRPALFGLNRQAVQLGSVREGVSVSVFKDLQAALEWLRAG